VHTFFVTSEFSPFAKAGGLADAVASLAAALGQMDATVSVLMPRYGSIEYAAPVVETIPLSIPFGHERYDAAVERIELAGVTLYLLEYNDLYRRPGIYGPSPAEGYADNPRRFAFLSYAAIALAATLDPVPDIIHAHDWPGALVPALLDTERRYPALVDTASVFSIHNFGHQGSFCCVDGGSIGLSDGEMRALHVGTHDSVNFLRSAIRHADRIVTVSPRYALEIQQPRFGFGLHREVQTRARDVHGILNGIDLETWNPEADPALVAPYSADDRSGKQLNKEALQRELGLPVDPSVPLIGMVTRLVEQKGVGPLFAPGNSLVYELCDGFPIQFVILGSGETWCEEEIRELSRGLPNFASTVGYSETLAHRIEAGADFFLMPSLYEPCGLNQMYSMRYGTIPIVTRTGGLADTVDTDTGFFIEESGADAIRHAVTRAINLYLNDQARIEAMRDAGMRRDFGWDRSAQAYASLYTNLIGGASARQVSA